MNRFKKLNHLRHESGITSIAFFENDRLVTTGSDMRIYVFEADLIDKDKEDFNLIGTLQYHLGASTSITTKGNLIASTSEDNEACTFKLNNNVLVNDKTLIRAKCPVNFLSFDTKGHYCALAMGDGAIKLVNLSDLIQVTNLKGHRKAVKCVCYDPKSDYIASTDAEGSLRIWDVVDLHDTKCVKIIDSFLNPTEKDSENLVRLSWNPSGTYLAVPISNREIAIIEHETWEIIAKIGPHTNEVSIISWSPNGVYLVAAVMDGSLSVWQPSKSTVNPVFSIRHSAVITGLTWHPTKNYFYFADNQGHINFSLNFMNNTDAEEFVDQFTTVEERYLKIAPLHSDSNTNQNGLDVLFDDDDFSDKESDVKKNFISNNKANQQFSAFEDVDNVGQKDKLTEKYLSNTYSISEDEEEKLENSDYEKDISNSNKCRNGQTVNTYSKFSSDQLDLFNTNQQSSFQPGSTPIVKGGKYYLSFNLIGAVYSVEQLSHSTIYVEFFDKSKKNFHLTDNYSYNLCSLGKSGIIFACQSSSTHPSTIFFRPIENWSSQNEWMIQFGTDSKEEPTGVALTKTYIVVSTSMNYLRFFSFGGLQLGLLCLQGSAVSMVGCDDYLLVVYHRGGVFQEEQNMGFLLFDNSRKCILKDALPISSTSKLIWIGFSEEGIPMTYDSVGILRGLIRNSESISNSYWLPFLDTRESSKKKKEFYWPVGVIAENFMTVICRDIQDHPQLPVPMLMELPILLPFLNMNTTGNLEERHNKGLLLLSQDELLKKEAHGIDTEAKSKFFKIKKELDKIALTLEVSTCKAKKSQLAIDICSILHSETSIDGAIKLALHNNLPVVAEKMSVIKEKIFFKKNFLEKQSQKMQLVDNSKLLQQESLVEEGVLQSQPSVEVITASTQETSVYLNSNKEITQNANFQEPNFEKKKQDVEHDHDTLINGAGGKSEEEKNFIRRKLEEKNNALKTHKVNRIENGSTKYVNPFALNKFQSPATSKADPKESEEVLKKRKLLLNDEGENAKKMKKDKSLQSFFKKSTGLDKNIKSIAKVHAVEVSRQNLNNENTYNENLLNLKKNNPLEVEDDTEAKISTTHTNTDLTANKKSSSFSKLKEEYGTTNNIDNLNAFNANTDLATKKFNVITIEPSSTTTQLRSTLDQSEVEEDLVEKATTSLTEAIAELRKQHDEIQVLKKDRMFDDEITEKEMEIIEKRVKLQQEQFKEFQSRDLKRKYKRFKQEWEFLTLEEVELALKETNENEEQAFLNFTDKTYIAKIRKNLCLNGSDVVISEEVKLEREKLVKRRVNLVKRVASDALKNKGSGRFKGARLDVALKQLENCEDKEEVFSGWSAARTTAYKAIDTNPNSYYYRFNAPGEKQKNGQWDAEEKKLFMARLREWGEVGQWGIFSQKIPGRVGYQCSNFYRLLLKNGEVKDENYYIDEEGQSHYLFGKKEGKEGVVRRNSKHWKEENKGKVGINNSCNNSNINNENTKFGGVKKRKSRSKLKKNIHEEDEDIDMEDEIDFDEFDSHYSSSSNNTGNPSSHNQTLGSEQDGKDESGYQPLKNPKRLKKDNRCEKVFTEKNLNPLPGFIDPITLDEVIKPAISPFGHVMSYESWTRCLSDPDRKNICPLTKKSLTKRELVVLTHENIEEYRDKIVNK